MKKRVILYIIVGILVLALAYYLISPIFREIEVNEERTSGEITLSGVFVPGDHEVMGEALVIEENGTRTLRFENFETINGPNLHIYLSKDLSAEDYIDLGGIKATKGNVSYEIPEGVNLEEYNKVLVWCVPFRIVFSSAELV